MTKDTHSSNLSILVVSCDRYVDVWPAFFTLFWKYWPDCPYPVYLGANRQIYPDERVRMILTSDDPSWAESTRRMVEHIKTPYLLMLLEDFFLRGLVITHKVQYCLTALQQLNGGYLRLKPFPKPDRKVPEYPEIGEIERGAPYRVALQAAIWRKDVLLGLLVNGESAWDMELIGSRRSDRLDVGFYSVWQTVLVYEAGVSMGKWLPFAIDFCQREGVAVDLSRRPKMRRQEFWNWQRRVWFNQMVNVIPWKQRRPIGDLLRVLGFLPPRRLGYIQ